MLGLHAPRRFDKIVRVHRCELQSEAANRVLEFVQERGRELEAYDPVEHTGFLRHVVLRSGKHPEDGTPALLVNFVTGHRLRVPLV